MNQSTRDEEGGKREKLGKIGRGWLPPMNAVMKQPAHLKKSTRWSDIALHTARKLPDVASVNSFRWDRPADYMKRFGGKPPSFLYCGDVMDQGACGACWAFSVALVHTSRLRIWMQQNVPMLSPTPILSCVKTQTSKGCSGGLPSEAAEYCLSTGIPSLECVDYKWCSDRTNYCIEQRSSQFGRSGSAESCGCENTDIPSCSNVGGSSCISCACPNASDSCSKPTCVTTKESGGNAASASTERYSFITVELPENSIRDESSQKPEVSLMTTGGEGGSGSNPSSFSAAAGEVADLQLRTMLEIFQHGPVQASYYVMSDFYSSTVSGGSEGEGEEQGSLWKATGGIYMNVPDIPDLYSSGSNAGRGGFSSTLQCQNSTGGTSTLTPSTCIIGGHAVAIIGFGSVAAARVPAPGGKFSAIRGPLEILEALGKPDAQVLCYWVCQNSWGSEWNGEQSGIANSDGLSKGKWWHAMSGTYEFVPNSSSSSIKVEVNNAIALDHPVTKPPAGGAPSGGLFGGVTTWPVATHMARFPFSRGSFFKTADKYAHTFDLVACSKLVAFPGGIGGSAENVGCVMVPAKFCTTEILMGDNGKPRTTCMMGAEGGGGSGDDDDGYVPEQTLLPKHNRMFYIAVGIIGLLFVVIIVILMYYLFTRNQHTPDFKQGDSIHQVTTEGKSGISNNKEVNRHPLRRPNLGQPMPSQTNPGQQRPSQTIIINSTGSSTGSRIETGLPTEPDVGGGHANSRNPTVNSDDLVAIQMADNALKQ